MDSSKSTNSVSKGVFVFKNATPTLKKRGKQSANKTQQNSSLLSEEVTNSLFYKTYSKTWEAIESDILKLQRESYTKTLEELANFIQDSYKYNFDNLLPLAALLTGINQPDHYQQFETLTHIIQEKLESNVTIIQSRDCSSLKSAVETMVHGFIEGLEEKQDGNHLKLKRSQCTMRMLHTWYINQCSGKEKTLVIILPDFESFNANILQDFILILSSYCERIPIVLVLGVATAISTVHNTLAYHVTSKIKLKVFQIPSAPVGLNRILNEVILSPKHNFYLSGKSLKFLHDIFLFYDFSINGFIQAYKYCLMEHFFQGNAYSLCVNYEISLNNLKQLTHEEFEVMRQMLSFRNFVENLRNPHHVLDVFSEGKYWFTKIPELLKNCHIYFKVLHCFLEFITCLVKDLPKSPLGKYRRELYVICTEKEITETDEFRECWQILKFYSKDEFIAKFEKAIDTTKNFMILHFNDSEIDLKSREIVSQFITCLVKDLPKSPLGKYRRELYVICTEKEITETDEFRECWQILKFYSKDEFIAKFEKAIDTTKNFMILHFNDSEIDLKSREIVSQKLKTVEDFVLKVQRAGIEITSETASCSKDQIKFEQLSRQELKEKLLQMSKREKPISEFTSSINSTLDYIKNNIITEHLCPLQKRGPTFYELFVFSDISTVRKNIIGTPRAALHTALNDPHFYLQCDCCELDNSQSLKETMLDISIVYKLHLECGRLINLFDWLQAFRLIVDYNEDESEQVDPKIQARFTRSVAELQFLGYIKTSKRKTDHVTRLTW